MDIDQRLAQPREHVERAQKVATDVGSDGYTDDEDPDTETKTRLEEWVWGKHKN